MFGGLGMNADGVVDGGADGVDAGLEPFKADQREPAIGSGDLLFALGAPRGKVFVFLRDVGGCDVRGNCGCRCRGLCFGSGPRPCDEEREGSG